MRQAAVYSNQELAGILLEDTPQYFRFRYEDAWFKDAQKPAISLTLPKNQQTYESPFLLPLFASKSISLQLNGHHNNIDNNGSNLMVTLNKYKNRMGKIAFEDAFFTYKFEGFTKGQKPFDFDCQILFRFDTMQYVFMTRGVNEISYPYSQLIDQTERLELVEKILKLVMQEIQAKHTPQ